MILLEKSQKRKGKKFVNTMTIFSWKQSKKKKFSFVDIPQKKKTAIFIMFCFVLFCFAFEHHSEPVEFVVY